MKKKRLAVALSVVGAVIITFVGISHGALHRSVMASLSEIYMAAINRDRIYEEGEAYNANMKARSVENLQDCGKPNGVSMDIEYHDTHEHGMQVFYFNEETFTDTIIMYIPGGGYTNNPLKYHWKIINTLSMETNQPVIMPIYLKVPNYTCEESYEKMIDFYLDVASRENVERIILIGDSSGGGMSLVLAQYIRDNYPEVLQPDDLILLAPWMDVSMDNEEIHDYEPVDPMLDIFGTRDIGRLWAGQLGVHHPMVSPIYGTFENLGRITMFVGTHDILCPDIEKFSDMLNEQGIDHTLIVKENLDHPYPLFPTPEAREAQDMMVEIINETDTY